MYRIAMEKLLKWKQGKHRKPFIIENCQLLKTIEDLGIYYYTNDFVFCEVDFLLMQANQ